VTYTRPEDELKEGGAVKGWGGAPTDFFCLADVPDDVPPTCRPCVLDDVPARRR